MAYPSHSSTVFCVLQEKYEIVKVHLLRNSKKQKGIFSAAYSIQPRKLIMKVGVGPVVGFGMLFGGLVASVMNPPWTMNVQWTVLSVSAFTYVVLVGTVAAFWCYLSGLKYVSAVIVGLMVCFEPLSAYLLSVFAFDLRIGMWEGAGICLVLLNVLVLSLPKKSSEAIKP